MTLSHRLFPLAPALVALTAALAQPASAQITPDATLGNEGSVLVPDSMVADDLADLIEGGAARGANLFHSFSDFNVYAGQQVYFANPAGIDAIISRVTGENPSYLFGTLGVDGLADLFFLNPNGIVFGEAAELDVPGSFYGTTATAVALGDGVYSAAAPDQNELLAVSPSATFWNYLTPAAGEISNRGTISAGENLTLAGGSLDLRGQIGAVGDVSLLAADTVQIRDGVAEPFVTLAGGDLLVQGNEQVDIVALSHEESGLFSYGDMVLRSAEQVGGDAHYWSGGSFRIEELDGGEGQWFSQNDPIIRSQGDVSFFAYQGASLHILAGGSVDMGTVIITGPDQTGTAISPETTPDLANVTLSDGTTLTIDGSIQPTLDVRAGMDVASIGLPLGPFGDTGTFFDSTIAPVLPPPNNPISTSANITVGDVWIAAPNGIVLLTNQYGSEKKLLRGDIRVTGEGVFGNGIDARNFNGLGGTVFIDARDNLSILDSRIDTSSVNDGGQILLSAGNELTIDGPGAGVYSHVLFGSGFGIRGDTRIKAQNLSVTNGAQIGSTIFDCCETGNILIDVDEDISIDGVSTISGRPSAIFNIIESNGIGTAGNIEIESNNLVVANGAQLGSSTFGIGDTGGINLNIAENILLLGSSPIFGEFSGIFSNVGLSGRGDGSDIAILANNIIVLDGAQITTIGSGSGNSGDILMQAGDSIIIGNIDSVDSSASAISSTMTSGSLGDGGEIDVIASTLLVSDGGQISSNTFGLGNSGNITINVLERLDIDGIAPDGFSTSEISSRTASDGGGGNILVATGEIQITNGGRLIATATGLGNGGDVVISAEREINLLGVNSGISSAINTSTISGGTGGNIRIEASLLNVRDSAVLSADTVSRGNGGDITIEVNSLEILQGGELIASTAASGNSGRVSINATEDIHISGRGTDDRSSNLTVLFTSSSSNGEIRLRANQISLDDGGTIISTAPSGNGGNLIFDIEDLLLLRRGSQISATAGAEQRNGNGGNVNIRVPFIVAIREEDSDITANAFEGKGGQINIFSRGLFGIEVRSSRTPFSDITASSELGVSGEVSLSTLDTGFIQNTLTELPDTLVNPDTLVANSCIARNNNPDGSFTITGNDGLPQQPGTPQAQFLTGSVSADIPIAAVQEPHGVYHLADGRLVLSQACAAEAEPTP